MKIVQENVKEALTKCGYNKSYSVECIHHVHRPKIPPALDRLHVYLGCIHTDRLNQS